MKLNEIKKIEVIKSENMGTIKGGKRKGSVDDFIVYLPPNEIVFPVPTPI
jgi:hypothetical protein